MITFVEQTGSTNADLLARIGAGEHLREGEWLVARRQSAGRGRQGRKWFDGAGNFMGSTVVCPGPGDPPQATLALVSGLAVYEALLPLCPDPAQLVLKWPNDVLVGTAKLAGILLESTTGRVVIGCGVNLRQAPQLSDRKTIALAEFARPPELEDFAETLARSFDAELERWRHHGLDLLLRRWQAAAHPLGAKLSVHDGEGATVEGSFAGLDRDGRLLLRLADGKTHAIHAGDVVIE